MNPVRIWQRYLPSYASLLKLALPLVLTQVGQMSVQLVDNAMVGRVGADELAAASFANSIYVVVMLFGMGVFLGTTPLIGRACGASDEHGAAAVIKSGFALSALLIPFITLITWSFTWIMPHMGQPEEVVRLAIPYYRTLAVSMVPFLTFALLKQIGEGLNNTMMAMIATIVSNTINVVFNYLLIFGKFGFPELGLLGAGYATLLSRIAMPAILFIGFRRLPPVWRYFSLLRSVHARWSEVGRIIRVGVPISTQMVLEVSSFSISAVMMGWLGAVPLAAHQVAMGLASFSWMAANGVALATTIRVSFQLGAKNAEGVTRTFLSAVHIVLGYMGLWGLAFLLLRNFLPRLFTTDQRVIEQAATLLVVAALFQLFDGLQVVCLGVLRGFADVRAPMFIAAFSYMAVGLSVSYLCAFTLGMGPAGIWYGFLAGLVFAGALLSWRIKRRLSALSPHYS